MRVHELQARLADKDPFAHVLIEDQYGPTENDVYYRGVLAVGQFDASNTVTVHIEPRNPEEET